MSRTPPCSCCQSLRLSHDTVPTLPCYQMLQVLRAQLQRPAIQWTRTGEQAWAAADGAVRDLNTVPYELHVEYIDFDPLCRRLRVAQGVLVLPSYIAHVPTIVIACPALPTRVNAWQR